MIVGPSLKMGGIERASCNIANELHVLGYKVVYLAIFNHKRFFELHSDIVFDEPTDGTNVSSLSMFKTLQRIRRQVQYHNPLTILAFNKFYSALTCLSLIGTDYRPFISERSSPLFQWPLKLRLLNRLAFLLKSPKGVIAQTYMAATFQRKYYGRNIPIRTIPNPVRDVKLHPTIPRKNFILAVGRLDDHLKGFERLVAVMPFVDQQWTLRLVGGSTDPKLERKIIDLKLEGRVMLAGKIQDLDPVYAEAGIFVIPSLSEGFPNALCEAMCAGLPCVSFRFVAGPEDLIEHGVNGILVDDGNIQAMAGAINTLIQNHELRMTLGNEAMKLRDKLQGSHIAKAVADFILQP